MVHQCLSQLELTGWVPLLDCLAVPETEGTLLDKPAVAPVKRTLAEHLIPNPEERLNPDGEFAENANIAGYIDQAIVSPAASIVATRVRTRPPIRKGLPNEKKPQANSCRPADSLLFSPYRLSNVDHVNR